MKKLGIILLVILLLLSFSLVACGKNFESTIGGTTSSNKTATSSTGVISRKNEGGMNENLWKILSKEMDYQDNLSLMSASGPYQYSNADYQLLALSYEENKIKDDLRSFLINGNDYFIPDSYDYQIGYFQRSDYHKSAGGNCFIARNPLNIDLSESSRVFLENTLWNTALDKAPSGSGCYNGIQSIPTALALVRFGAFSQAAREANSRYTYDYCDYVVSFMIRHMKPELTGLEQNVTINGKDGKLKTSYLYIGYSDVLPQTKIGNYYLTFEYEENDILYTASVGLGYLCEELNGERKTLFNAEIFTHGKEIMESVLSKLM